MSATVADRLSPLAPPLPTGPGERVRWTGLYGAAHGLAVARAAAAHAGPLMVVTEDPLTAVRLEEQIGFFGGADVELLHFPDWETLPYDVFSPHQDIVSERLATLARLPALERGILILPVNTLMSRVPPPEYVRAHSFRLAVGERFVSEGVRDRLLAAGYRRVGEVMEHGEFAVRGSLFDVFPMGAARPYRIDLLDDEIESIRAFDPETQRSIERVATLEVLPAREFPIDEAGVARFRQGWRERFEGDPTACPLYRDVSDGLLPAGIEYYLPLFFERTATLFDYFPAGMLAIVHEDAEPAAGAFWREARERFEQRRHDVERPVLAPARLFLEAGDVFGRLEALRQVRIGRFGRTSGGDRHDFATRMPVQLPVDPRAAQPLAPLREFVQRFGGRVLFVAETPGRREVLLETLAAGGLRPGGFSDFAAFLAADAPTGIVVAGLEHGAVIDESALAPAIAVITEHQLFGERAMQRRRRRREARDAESVLRELTQLAVGDPVVHEHHGVGRYRGLQTLDVGGIRSEFLALEYADGDRLYVPVASLHLVSRYTGADPDLAPLHKLGSQQWQKARRRAAERAHDVAAELLEIHARRAARPGHVYDIDAAQYAAFASGFPFEETPDQDRAIEQVLADMKSERPMDRLVCGDVGFGKTEVAMRAAFGAVLDGWQVCVLVPTTLLAQQHHQTFSDRFADWPVRIEQLSRFRSRKDRDAVVADLRAGKVDIVIGTHKVLQGDVRFKHLGLVVIDEEHRFGVRQKEQLKALRAEVDVLTLTATPIPRTLNMALSGLRDLSLIATPPERRLSIKTFVSEWDGALVREACLREIRRGGQVYFVHNRVEDIERIADEVRTLVPEASARVAHGQMRERDLEHVMLDFYHRRFNVLVCTTIIETGIDVPTANTMIIHRADRFGLAQLHQLRGRVGRSHHRAYAYLVIPPRAVMSADAVKRLEAIESLDELGIGFSLSTHDLEIRGAGELLGEGQSGQIQAVGYSLYTRFLERAVSALRAGRSPQLDRPLDHGAEIDLRTPALIPEDYLPDVHMRLIMYKRIASAPSREALGELRGEMIDRFGPLPDAALRLFQITALKLKANALGVRRIDFGERGGRMEFDADPKVDAGEIVRLVQSEPQVYRLAGSDRLRVTREMPGADERIRAADELLEALSAREAA